MTQNESSIIFNKSNKFLINSMAYNRCEYEGCEKKAVYDLLWESYDDNGNTVEPDTNNWRASCNSHLVELVKEHEFGTPVDEVILTKKHVFLPKLRDWINVQIEHSLDQY